MYFRASFKTIFGVQPFFLLANANYVISRRKINYIGKTVVDQEAFYLGNPLLDRNIHFIGCFRQPVTYYYVLF